MKIPLALAALLASAALAESAPPGRHVVQKEKLRPESVRGGSLGEPLSELRWTPEAFDRPTQVLQVAAPGTRVRKGDVLLRLDPARLDEALADAEAADRAGAESERLFQEELKAQRLNDEAALASAQAEAELAELELKGFLEIQAPLQRREAALATLGHVHALSDQKEELDQLEAMYKASELAQQTKEIVLERARRDLERRKEGLEIQKRRESDQLAKDQARQEAQLRAHAARKAAALAAARISTAAQTARKALQAEGAATERRKAAERLAALRRDRERLTMTASRDGIVLHGPFLRGKTPLGAPRLSAGDRAEPFTPLITLMGAEGTLLACTRVTGERLGDFREGMKVRILPDSDPRRVVAGTVREASPLPASASDDGRVPYYRIVIAPESPLPPGSEAEVLPEPSETVAVPSRAVRRENGKATCRVEGKDGREEVRDLVLGGADGDLLAVRAGLEPGETVLIEAASK